MKKVIYFIIGLLLIAGLFGSCVKDDYTADDLEGAKSRYFTGTATKEDKTMVEGFYKWKAEQND